MEVTSVLRKSFCNLNENKLSHKAYESYRIPSLIRLKNQRILKIHGLGEPTKPMDNTEPMKSINSTNIGPNHTHKTNGSKKPMNRIEFLISSNLRSLWILLSSVGTMKSMDHTRSRSPAGPKS